MAHISGTKDIPRPIRDIGCQQLLQQERVEMQGTLRLRKGMHELLDKISTKTSISGIKWPRVYVILHNSCLYIFNSETSKSASKAFSLLGFTAAKAHQDEVAGCRDPWPFKLNQDLSEDPKTYYFSAPSEPEMSKWVDNINRQPVVSALGGSIGQRLKLGDIATRARLPTPQETDLSYETGHASESDDSDYEPPPVVPITPNQTDDRKLRPAFSPPIAVKQSPALKLNIGPHVPGNKETKPAVKPKPNAPPVAKKSPQKSGVEDICYNEVLYVAGDDYPELEPEVLKRGNDLFTKAYWSDSNEEAERLMRGLNSRGVYMVRNSNATSNHCHTLLVSLGDEVLKKLKVLKNEAGKFSLNPNGPYFPSVSDLIKHYSYEVVPGVDVKLLKPWSECTNLMH